MARPNAPPEQIKENARKRNKRYYDKQPKGFRKQYAKDYWSVNPQKQMWHSAKHRARIKNLEFTITEEDIVLPGICPILGTVFKKGTKQNRDLSYSLDRIDISKGYIPGNIAVISFKANKYKNDMSLEVIKKLADYALSENR